MPERTFVGISMCGGSGADFEKVFQSGHTRILIRIDGFPAEKSNELVRGGKYRVSYMTEDITKTEGDDIFLRKGTAAKI